MEFAIQLKLIVEDVIVVALIAVIHVLVALGAVAAPEIPIIGGQLEQGLPSMGLAEMLQRCCLILVLVMSLAATLAPAPARALNSCWGQRLEHGASRLQLPGFGSGLVPVLIHHTAGWHVSGLGYALVQLGRALQHIVQTGSGLVSVEQTQRQFVVGEHVALHNNAGCDTQQSECQLPHFPEI